MVDGIPVFEPVCVIDILFGLLVAMGVIDTE
jgi:hypothetical protein